MFGKKEYTPEQLYKVKRMALIADVVLIILFIGIFAFGYSEIESVKFLLNDPCKVCMDKTGATCITGVYNPNPESSGFKIPIPNITQNNSNG